MNRQTQGRASDIPSDADLQRAIALHQSGHLADAEVLYRAVLEGSPRHADALSLLGVVKTQLGSPEEGLEWIGRALDEKPGEPAFLNNRGMALMSLGRTEEAVPVFAEATQRSPDLAQLWFNLGNALREVGSTEPALDAYERALDLDQGNADVHHNLGATLLDRGALDDAKRAFRRALTVDPRHGAAHQNLGVVHYRLGELDQAEEAFRAALECAPGATGAINNLGRVLRDKGDAVAAMEHLWDLVRKDTGNTDAWLAFASAFRQVRFRDGADLGPLLNVLLACLVQDGIDHQDLGRQAIRLLSRDPALARVLDLAKRGDGSALDAAIAEPDTIDAFRRPVVRLALERIVLPDVAFERTLCSVRRFLLERAAEGAGSAHLDLLTSVARQCFLNGYVWAYGGEEVAAVEGLVAAMADRALGTDAEDQARIAALACYVPLLQWERASEVALMVEQSEDPALLGLTRQQVVEPYQEMLFREGIPSYGPVTDEVSRSVQAQYEEHPYPRWTSVNRWPGSSVVNVVQELFRDTPVPGAEHMTSPRVLVAGCGTGKHLIDVAFRFRDAQVTGIDLSRASLGYALRKCCELGLDDVRLMQADILGLGGWGERFEIVECGGVLHHMQDPVAGWRVLAGLLVPDGLMHIGLYSEAARREVVEARSLVEDGGFEATEEGIREARLMLIEHFAGRGGQLQSWRDFYSMEECRDLVFHVQEQRFTIPRIAAILDELGLRFLGFELEDRHVAADFRERFPERGSSRVLERWDTFERENPGTFSGMYQFWVRKPGTGDADSSAEPTASAH